jgi:hypothetical protein
MACGGCMGARRNLVTAVRQRNITGVVGAIRQAAQINIAKATGTYRETRFETPTVKATPYRRPPERTS